MFDLFRIKFSQDGGYARGRQSVSWIAPKLQFVTGYADYCAEFAGASFDGGLYRVHNAESASKAGDLLRGAFPDFAKRIVPFGYDWLGRQFAFDFGRMREAEPQILLLEPGTGQALEIPTTFMEFCEVELTTETNAALAVEFFDEWSMRTSRTHALTREQCVGYVVPLYLGGSDTVENLSITQLDVYWELCGQMLRSTRALQVGASIASVEFTTPPIESPLAREIP
ncbi:T6SS immunity protein Tdi1 domain-containing protein [Microbacterium aurantiacum]|uniref:T6SS immunity protein Tdi1 domain-containing protein n=1 Tax=Microbacterium aurantiacum TaxID=162393 RepID=UPI000C8100C6|nr:T6SS immunity protein Tdi1 domain-containing protein [Microbacterium aurantiacum]